MIQTYLKREMTKINKMIRNQLLFQEKFRNKSKLYQIKVIMRELFKITKKKINNYMIHKYKVHLILSI